MPHGVTRVRPWENQTSKRIKDSSDVVTEVIPRDTNTNTERYIIFTGGEALPGETKVVLERLQEEYPEKNFEIRALSGHDAPDRRTEDYPVNAITYENTETHEKATYLFAARSS